MGGMIIFGACLIGATLVMGHYLFPDSVIMWFASADTQVVMWRDIVVIALVLLAVVREYFHNLYLQTMWGMAGIGLLWSGSLYFLNNPSHVFDAMLLLNAGVAFAISALVPCAEPVNIRPALQRLASNRFILRYARPSLPAERLAGWRYISDGKELSHRLVLGEQLHRSVKA